MLTLSRHFASLLIIFHCRSTPPAAINGQQRVRRSALAFFIALICILDSLLPAVGADYYGGNGRPLNPYACGSPRTCYSCASVRFKRHWSSYSAFFQRPLNFTEHCDPPLFRLKAPTDTCVAPCLTLIEPVYILGQEVAKAYFRGCFDKFFSVRQIEDVALEHLMHSGESCRAVPRRTLFGGVGGRQAAGDLRDNITLCSCICDKCNTHPEFRRSSGSTIIFLSSTTFRYFLLCSWLFCIHVIFRREV